MESIQRYLTKDYITKLETMHLDIAAKINAGYSGTRKSNAKGNSLEFSDYRDYSPGDDLRRIDWNGYGRLDKLFIKLFMEEKQAVVNIFLDKSKSMDFGDMNKYTYARLLAASIAYLAMNNSDKINIYCCDTSISFQKTNMSSKNVFYELVRFLDGAAPGGETTFNQAILSANGMRLGQGASFLISDLFSRDGFEEAVQFLQNRKQHVRLMHVLDRTEIEPKLSDALRLIDSETGVHEDIFINHDVLKAYVSAFSKFQSQVKGFCERRGAVYMLAPTDTNILKLFNTRYAV